MKYITTAHKHFPLSCGSARENEIILSWAQRFASVLILLYSTYNEKSTKIFKVNALKRYL